MSFVSTIATLENALEKTFPASTYVVSYGAKVLEGNGNVTPVEPITMEDFFANLLNMPTESIFVTVEEREPRRGRPFRRILTKAFDLAHTDDDLVQRTVQRMHAALNYLTVEHAAQ